MATCFLKTREFGDCGEFRGIAELVSLDQCRNDLSQHLSRCHLSRERIMEGELILVRSGLFYTTETQRQKMLVCPKHRAYLGQYWGNQTKLSSCKYPDHKGEHRAVRTDRAFTLKVSREVMEVFAVLVPVGAPICSSCRKAHSKRVQSNWPWLQGGNANGGPRDEDDAVLLTRKSKDKALAEMREIPPDTPTVSTPLGDFPWTPGQWRKLESVDDDSTGEDMQTFPDQTFEVYNTAMAQIAGLSDIKILEPLTFRLKVDWGTATEKEKQMCEEKVDEACRAVCKVIAPSSSEELLKSYVKRVSRSDKEVEALTSAYRQAPTKNLKTQILSIYALRYTSNELKAMHAPFEKLSDRQIKKARTHAKTVGVGLEVEKVTHYRVRIDRSKLEHFLDFVDQPYFYQDVSFGTRTVKLDSGQQMVMPNVLRTVGRSTMIEQYHQWCREEDYQPLGRSTLYRILKVREASQRKSLQGLDNTASSGAEGFDTLNKIVDDLEQYGARHKWCEGSRDNLKGAKRYLKTSYRAHCREDSDNLCAEHCREHALSDTQCLEFKTSCTRDHMELCESCDSLRNTLGSVLSEIKGSQDVQFYSRDQQEDMLYDAAQAQDMVLQWKAHILRAENQDRAKTDAVNCLQSDTILIVMDWAMKFIQMKYREKQSEWYGKRGMNWHISCVLSKPADREQLEVTSYVHLFDNCAQDSYTVYAIIKHLLKTLKIANPHISKALLRSDGAGCYHNNNLIAALNEVHVHTGISVLRYDFSEPQFGKDVCDRIISPLKGVVRRFCNEGNDILSAADMREALKVRPVKRCTAAVCEIERTDQEIKVNCIPNFSTFHSFSYEGTGLRMWKAYDIGAGKLVLWSDLDVQVPGAITLKPATNQLQFWDVQPRCVKLQGKTNQSVKLDTETALFECNEAGCSHSFDNYDALQDHINFGNHDPISTNQESVYDKLRREWVRKFSAMSVSEQKPKQPTSAKSTMTATHAESSEAGWALQKPRGSGTRFSENVKSYLQARFDVGVQTGRKSDPVQVSADMRSAKNQDGTRKFSRDEWLTKLQVQAFFSRLAAAQKKQVTQRHVEKDDENTLLDEDLAHLDQQNKDEDVQEVLSQIGLEHPITYDGYDICDLVKTEALSRSTVKELRVMCDHFELPRKSTDKKAALIKHVTDMVEECSCS